jgi:hypothetical protein
LVWKSRVIHEFTELLAIIDVLDEGVVVIVAPGHVAAEVDMKISRVLNVTAWPKRQTFHFRWRWASVHFSLYELPIGGPDDDTINFGEVSVGDVARSAVVGR